MRHESSSSSRERERDHIDRMLLSFSSFSPSRTFSSYSLSLFVVLVCFIYRANEAQHIHTRQKSFNNALIIINKYLSKTQTKLMPIVVVVVVVVVVVFLEETQVEEEVSQFKFTKLNQLQQQHAAASHGAGGKQETTSRHGRIDRLRSLNYQHHQHHQQQQQQHVQLRVGRDTATGVSAAIAHAPLQSGAALAVSRPRHRINHTATRRRRRQ